MARKPPPPVFGWWPAKGKLPNKSPPDYDKNCQFYCPECYPTDVPHTRKRTIPLEPPNRRGGPQNRYPDWFYYCGDCGYPVEQLVTGFKGVPFEMKPNSVAPPQPNTRGTKTLRQLKSEFEYVASPASRERMWNPPPAAGGFAKSIKRFVSSLFCGNNNTATVDPRVSMRAPTQPSSNQQRNWWEHESHETVPPTRENMEPPMNHYVNRDQQNAIRAPSRRGASIRKPPARFHTTFQQNYQPPHIPGNSTCSDSSYNGSFYHSDGPPYSAYSGSTSAATSTDNDDYDNDDQDDAASVVPDEEEDEEEQALPVFAPRGRSFAANQYNQAAPISRFITGSYRPSARRQQIPWQRQNETPSQNFRNRSNAPALKTLDFQYTLGLSSNQYAASWEMPNQGQLQIYAPNMNHYQNVTPAQGQNPPAGKNARFTAPTAFSAQNVPPRAATHYGTGHNPATEQLQFGSTSGQRWDNVPQRPEQTGPYDEDGNDVEEENQDYNQQIDYVNDYGQVYHQTSSSMPPQQETIPSSNQPRQFGDYSPLIHHHLWHLTRLIAVISRCRCSRLKEQQLEDRDRFKRHLHRLFNNYRRFNINGPIMDNCPLNRQLHGQIKDKRSLTTSPGSGFHYHHHHHLRKVLAQAQTATKHALQTCQTTQLHRSSSRLMPICVKLIHQKTIRPKSSSTKPIRPSSDDNNETQFFLVTSLALTNFVYTPLLCVLLLLLLAN